MNELLFFVLGLVIGWLSGIISSGTIQFNKLTKTNSVKCNDYKDDEKCENEK